MKTAKKCLAILTALCMVLGFVVPVRAAENTHTIVLSSTQNSDGSYSHTAVYNGTAVKEYDYTWHADPSTVHSDVKNSPAEYYTGTAPGNEAVYIAHDIYYYPELPTSGFTRQNYDGEQEWCYYYTASGYTGYIFSTLPGRSSLPTSMMHSAEEAYQNAVLHITQPGDYIIQGDWHGQIWVDLANYCDDPFTDPTAKVNLILNGVTVNCTVAAGLVFYNVYECDNTWEDQSSWSYKVDTSEAGAVVTLADGTVNSVTGTNITVTPIEGGTTGCSHNYTAKVTTAATCTASGIKTYICSLCGDSYTEVIPASGHSYQAALQQAATCTDYAVYSMTCSACGDSYTVTADKLASQWLDAIPNGMSSSDFETQTLYRYRDLVPGAGEWAENENSTIYYVNQWPSGFDTSNSLYTQYNNADNKVTAYENDTEKLVIHSDELSGYLYYHWCRAGYQFSSATKSFRYNRFHAYYSTKTPEQADKTDTSDNSYRFDDSTACSDCKWYFAVPVYAQSYTTYSMTAADTWGDWSDWSATAVTASDSRQVETAVQYRFANATLAGHNYRNGSCTLCGAADPDNTVPVAETYYLVGYINGADYGCESDYANMGQYKFVNGKLTATFTQDSYVFVKTEGNGKWLLAESYCTDTTCTFFEGKGEKMFVPGSVEITFTLTENTDGSVTVSYTTGSAAASTVPTLTLKAPTLEFKDMICVIAFYTAENTQDVVELGMITYSSNVGTANIATAEHAIPGADYDEATGRYYSSSQGIHAKYLGDTVYLAIYAKLADGTYAYSKLAPYSPVTYATSQLKNSTDTKLKQLVAAMLNYGAEAQLYFGHNTGSLANASLTAEQKALPESYRADMVSSVPAASAAKQGSFASNKGFASRKPAISFEGAFCINYFFTPNYAPDNGITLYYWNAADFNNASVLTTANATGSIQLDGSGTGEYRGDIVGISAKAISEAVFVAAVYTNGGTTWTSGVLGYSIGAYCSSQASKGGDIADLAMATAVYGYHAKAYFG